MSQYIYVLYDPRTPEHISYVGKTNNLKNRMRGHLKDARYKSDKKANWIKSLMADGLQPIGMIIEEIDTEHVNEREIYWISYYRELNQADKNHMDGGDGFTSNAVKKMHEERAIKYGRKTVEQKKAELLSFPLDSSRPKKNSELGKMLEASCSTKGLYDNDFDIAIRERFPMWFNENRIAANKKELLGLLEGSPRPKNHVALGTYTNKRKSTYDPIFDAEIRKKFPHWFNKNRTDHNKQVLLDMSVGSDRPEKGSKLSNALNSYVRITNESYDSVFADGIREKFPHWFNEKRIKNYMNILLEMAIESKRPDKRSLIGTALRHYVDKNDKMYKPDFDSAIRNRFPNWFDRNLTNIKKEKLLNTISGTLRKNLETSLHNALSLYTSKNSESYDPEFEKTIRELHPNWFRRK